MSVDDNKRLVRDFLTFAAARDADRVASLMGDDATFWRCGKPELLRFAGEQTKAQYVQYLREPIPFKERMTLTIGAITAEGDRVAIEVGLHGVLNSGQIYDNAAHFLFIVRNGLIVSIREYMDTQHVADLFMTN